MMSRSRAMGMALLASLLASSVFADDVLLQHVNVFTSGEVIDGLSYNTYRIPNIARANDGTLIAVAEARLGSAGDPGATHIDLVYKRSLDGGQTWTEGHILDRHPDTVLGPNNVPTDRTSASNSVTFVNRDTGRIWNLDMRLPSGVPGASVQPGVDDMQTWARYSDDSGATWSTATRIAGNTAAIPYEDFYPNLGSATQLSSGRLVVPATQINAGVASRSFALYSDDAGVTWSAGTRVNTGTNEAQIVELVDGRLLMTARQNSGGGRLFAISDNQGASWNPTFTGFASTTVMEAIERYTQAGVSGQTVNRLLHTIPVGGPVTARTNLEIMTATDEAQNSPTFGSNRRIMHGWTAYSDLVKINEDEVGVFWERGDTGHNQAITYTRLNRAFLEPDSSLRSIAHEGFDYAPGTTLDAVSVPTPAQGYAGGFAPVNFSGRTDLDLIFSISMDAGGGGTTMIDPGIVANDRANGIYGQLFTTEGTAGAVSQITVQRADTGAAGGPVFLHVYSDTNPVDGIDPTTFLGASLTAESLNPTNSGVTAWAFDGTSTVLSPNTQYLFAFANSATAGDTTTARAALYDGVSLANYALGGNGFNSAWHSTVTDLTNGPGASTAAVVAGSLHYWGLNLPTQGNHIQLDGAASLARGLGIGLDLDTPNNYFASLLVTRAADNGPDDATGESLEIHLADSSGTSHVRFGVDSDEAFFLDGPGGLLSTADDALDPSATYLLVMKIVSQDDSNGGNFDQVYLAAFESGEPIPDFEDEVSWTLAGVTGTNKNAFLDRMLLTGGPSAVWSLDELRVGGAFGSVASGVFFTFTGDLNGDDMLDVSDWLVFKANYATNTAGLSPTRQLVTGDLNQDDIIDLFDFVAFKDIYNTVNGAGSFSKMLASIPEPSGWMLLQLGGMGLLMGRYGVITSRRRPTAPSLNPFRAGSTGGI